MKKLRRPAPGLYRHYKGKLYRVHFTALHSETREPLVVYETMYRNNKSKYWVRPASMFCEKITIDGATLPRFKKMGLEKNPLRNPQGRKPGGSPR